jgi:NAD(P)-dependent dehydrogenase (short-subunit alcohol dehydrogenase family)
MAGRFTLLVVIQVPLPSCIDSLTQATTNCGSWRWMSLTPLVSRPQRQNLTGPLTCSSTMLASWAPRVRPLETLITNAWAKVLDANTMGPMRVSEAFIDNVARSDRKLIVTLTSGMGSLADNTSGGSTAYRSSKAAVNMVMRSMAIDLAPRGIICVVVNPGWVQTAMGGPHAKITPAESVTKLKRLIETLGPPQSGKFFNYDGKEYPW